MTVGAYLRPETARSLGTAGHSDSDAEHSRDLARRYELQAGADASVADKLAALKVLGWKVMIDRCWHGSKRAPVDAILVGPGGVVVLDVGDWTDVDVRAGSIYRGLECRDADASRVRSITDRVQDALVELGVTRQALWSVLLYAGRRLDAHTQQVHLVGEENLAAWVSARPARLEDSEIDALATLLEGTFPAYDADAPLAVRVPPTGGGRFDVQQLASALHRTAAARPLERWMTFLRPEQLALVGTSWDGPARISGAPGTGKTVVGLHRATYLADRNAEPVLYVAPTTALPARLSSLSERLAPQVRDRVVFTSLIDLARAIVEQTGERLNVDARQSSIAFMSAWMSVRGGQLSQVDERAAYWQEEIDHVIKARGIKDFEVYAALDRAGRGAPLDLAQREAMWRLYTDYMRRLDKCRVHDVNDVLTAARDLLREGLVRPSYSAVIADEAQDLPLVGLQLLHALAGDGPDRLLLLDDGQQAVHPGGCTLAEAGIRIVEPTVSLVDDHRCSADVLQVATELVRRDEHADLAGGMRAHTPGVPVRRRGAVPTRERLTEPEALDRATVDRLVEICEASDAGWGGTAVLVESAADLEHLRGVLMRAALPVAELDGHPATGNRVTIGTYAGAKGLEFDHVLLPGATEEPLRLDGEHEAAHRERAQRCRRQQYVAMTRARHGLWLGLRED